MAIVENPGARENAIGVSWCIPFKPESNAVRLNMRCVVQQDAVSSSTSDSIHLRSIKLHRDGDRDLVDFIPGAGKTPFGCLGVDHSFQATVECRVSWI